MGSDARGTTRSPSRLRSASREPSDRDARDDTTRGRSQEPDARADDEREPREGGAGERERERERSRSPRERSRSPRERSRSARERSRSAREQSRSAREQSRLARDRSHSPPRRSDEYGRRRAYGRSRSPSVGDRGRGRFDHDRLYDRRYERRQHAPHDDRHGRYRSRYHDRRSPPRPSGGYDRRRHGRSRSPSGGRDRRPSSWRAGGDGGKKKVDDDTKGKHKDLFFDGFQWVSKPLAGAEVAAAADATGSAQKERRIHIGNLPLGVGLTPPTLSAWVCEQMALHGLQTPALEGALVSSCWISPEGGYAFIELRTAAEATASLRLHTQLLHGQPVKFSRPNNYTPAPGSAAPPQPPPLGAAAQPPALSASALAALVPQLGGLLGVDLALQAAAAAARAQPQRVVSLANFVLAAELDDADEREDIARALAAECAMIGPIESLLVPLSSADAEPPKVYVQFATVADAQAALAKMQARAFDGRVLAAAYVGDGEYAALQAAHAAQCAAAATAE